MYQEAETAPIYNVQLQAVCSIPLVCSTPTERREPRAPTAWPYAIANTKYPLLAGHGEFDGYLNSENRIAIQQT